MSTSSEYVFPIFISSTDYNLIDLRAELAKYLADLGYKPILSSSEGFHDCFPNLEPWESCLQVLQSSFVMILIIDDRYGDALEWKNFSHIFGDRKISPTHAEYLFAHISKMRMLVFVRKHLLTYYQVYRETLKKSGSDKDKAKEILKVVLPGHISFETLDFISEIKSSNPIPWIKSFENVTDIKREVQKKMLNELAELFMSKNSQLENVSRKFSAFINDMPENKRKETLEKIGYTKDLMAKVENQTQEILLIKKEKDKLQQELEQTAHELEKALKEKKVSKSSDLQKQVEKLGNELGNLDLRITGHELASAKYLITGSTMPLTTSGLSTDYLNPINNLNNGYLTIGGMSTPNSSYLTDLLAPNSIFVSPSKCEKCHTESKYLLSSTLGTLKKCPSCKRMLCGYCFNGEFLKTNLPLFTECIECRNKKVSEETKTKK